MEASLDGGEPSRRLMRAFVSHSSADLELARSLTAAIADETVEVWLAADELSVGDNYAEEIYRRLRVTDYVIVIVSHASLRSAHVRREVSAAIDLGKPLLPVTLHAGLMASPEMPLDWRYWLGIVQVYPLSSISETVGVLREHMVPRAVAHPVKRRSSSEPETDLEIRRAIRAQLIQVALEDGTFSSVLARCRRIDCSRAVVAAVTRDFRASGLVAFDDPLLPETSIHLLN